MLTLAIFLLVLTLLGLAALLLLQWRLAGRIDELGADAARYAPTTSGGTIQAAGFLPGPRTRITIEILNPMELAAQQHWIAGTLGSLAPALVRKIVNEMAMRIIRDELVKYGAKAELGLIEAP